MSINPDAVYERLIMLGEDYADKDAAASLQEEVKKILLARLMLKSSATSAAAKEMEALGDPAYEIHIGRMIEARQEAQRAKVKWLSAQAWADAARTQAASERAANRYAT